MEVKSHLREQTPYYGRWDIYIMDSDGTNEALLITDGGLRYDLWVMNSDGTDKQQLTFSGKDQHAIYSPDGK